MAQNDPLESVLRAFRRPRSSGKRTYGGRRHLNDRQLSQSYNSAGLATNDIFFHLPFINSNWLKGKIHDPYTGRTDRVLFCSFQLLPCYLYRYPLPWPDGAWWAVRAIPSGSGWYYPPTTSCNWNCRVVECDILPVPVSYLNSTCLSLMVTEAKSPWPSGLCPQYMTTESLSETGLNLKETESALRMFLGLGSPMKDVAPLNLGWETRIRIPQLGPARPKGHWHLKKHAICNLIFYVILAAEVLTKLQKIC